MSFESGRRRTPPDLLAGGRCLPGCGSAIRFAGVGDEVHHLETRDRLLTEKP
jgi:hypothetical protein